MNKNTRDGLIVLLIIVLEICVLQVGAICSDEDAPPVDSSTDTKVIGLSGWKIASSPDQIVEVEANEDLLYLRQTFDFEKDNKYPSVYKKVKPPQKIGDECISFEIFTSSDKPLPESNALSLGFYLNGKKKPVRFKVPVKNEKWVKVSIPLFNICDKEYVQIYFQTIVAIYHKSGFSDGDQVEFKIKNLRFSALKNRVENGSFEQGKSHWSLWPSPAKTKTVFDIDNKIFKTGTASARITAVDSADKGYLVNYVNLEAGKSYTISFWHRSEKVEELESGIFRISFSFAQKTGKYGSAGKKAFNLKMNKFTKVWKRFEKTLIIPENAVKARYTMGFAKVKGVVWIDDVKLEKK